MPEFLVQLLTDLDEPGLRLSQSVRTLLEIDKIMKLFGKRADLIIYDLDIVVYGADAGIDGSQIFMDRPQIVFDRPQIGLLNYSFSHVYPPLFCGSISKQPAFRCRLLSRRESVGDSCPARMNPDESCALLRFGIMLIYLCGNRNDLFPCHLRIL